MVCRKCQKEIPEGSVYCMHCGVKQAVEPSKARKRANGTGYAKKRGRTWTVIVSEKPYVEYREDGTTRLVQPRRSKGGFRTKTEALEYAPKLKHEVAEHIPTLAELWAGWSRNDMRKISEAKQTAYEIARRRLEPIISRPINTLTLDDLQAVINDAATAYYPARDMKTVLSHLYRRAIINGKATVNLAQYLVLPELEEAEANPFTADEVQKMWAAYSDGDTFVGYILLMIYSGMMPVELIDCKKSMINWDACEIFGCGHKTKKRKQVAIVFPDFLRPVVKALCDFSGQERETLLPCRREKFYKSYYEALERMGVRRLTPYSCRHTTATEAVKAGVSPAILQQIMRHARITTQERYVHVGSAAAHEGVNQLPGKSRKTETEGVEDTVADIPQKSVETAQERLPC